MGKIQRELEKKPKPPKASAKYSVSDQGQVSTNVQQAGPMPTPSAAPAPMGIQGTPTYDPGWKNQFGLTFDAAKNLPSNPGGWNNEVETLRKVGVDVADATIGAVIRNTLGPVDNATGGALSKALMYGTNEVRSNYAFTRDLENRTTGMGLLSGLLMLSAGVGGGILGAFVGGPVGIWAGATLGIAAAGRIGREVSETGALGNAFKTSSDIATTKAGQEKYNFGRDVVTTISEITGSETFGDTTMGIGAITSGILNFGFEIGTSPDIGAAKVAGAAGRKAFVAPIKETGGKFSSKLLSPVFEAQTAERLARDVDLLKRTGAGETTVYTPMFEFFKSHTSGELMMRKGFDNEVGMFAAQVLAGQSDEVISLALRAGRGDLEALDILAAQRADIANNFNRLNDGIRMGEKDGLYFVSYDGKTRNLGKVMGELDDTAWARTEVEALRKQISWLDNALVLDSRLADRTVGKWAWVERARNDAATRRIATKLEMPLIGNMETVAGKVFQTVYQNGPLGMFVRSIDRGIDDVPRGTINFNDVIQTPERLRTNLRASVAKAGLLPERATDIYNRFVSATNELEKLKIINDYTAELAQTVGKKYGVSGDIIDLVLSTWDNIHGTWMSEARKSKDLDVGYMFGPGGVDDILNDPQLITQLANGAFLPDPKMWDLAFKRYSKKHAALPGAKENLAVKGKYVLDEFQSLWRAGTLLRGGYPLNIIRDSAVRVYGDGALFPLLTKLTQDTINTLANSTQTVGKIKDASIRMANPKKNLERIYSDISDRAATIEALQKVLQESGYDPKKPPKELSETQKFNIEQLNNLNRTVKELRRQEAALVANKKTRVVARDKMINIEGYTFPAAFSGRFGDLSAQALIQKDDIRRAVKGIRELELENVRRSRTGVRSILPGEDEGLHLVSWQQTLQDKIGFDPVARMIMEGRTRQEIIKYLRSPESKDYMTRMGAESFDAPNQYEKVLAVVEHFAPNKELYKPILNGTLSVDTLRKLYPNIEERPPVLTDMANDMLGQSNAYQKLTGLYKDGVAWLSTAPTSKLMYSPYFAVKYEEKLQSLIYVANLQKRVLTDKDKDNFEAAARAYGIREYKNKLNSFHRDMNYNGIFNYVLAFFPAIIEQYRAYGRIFLEHPDFLIKAAQISSIPERLGVEQEDPYGNKFVEVPLPMWVKNLPGVSQLGGSEIKGRINSKWFNVFNPTGNSLVSGGPLLTSSVNVWSKQFNVENKFTQWALPFGTQTGITGMVTANTARRLAQAGKAQFLKSGDQFNIDTNMFLRQIRFDYINANHKEPSADEVNGMSYEAQERATGLAWLRFLSSISLPAQPRYVTGLQGYADELQRMVEADPVNGEQTFLKTYPDYFLLTSKLSDSAAGIGDDATSVALLKDNKDTLNRIVANIGPDNLNVLGAVFNDENYAFSSAARAYLQSTDIPGYPGKKFKDSKGFLEATTKSIVAKGWSDFSNLKEIVIDELTKGGMNPNRGYGKNMYDQYMDSFIQGQKEKNNVWYEEYTAGFSGGSASRQAATVKALSIAANTPKMWKELSKQPRWGTIVEYLNFRYTVYDELQRTGSSLDSMRNRKLREDTADYVLLLRKRDINFGKFYDRYFDNDKFDYVYGG
jgi:hypothetical protein